MPSQPPPTPTLHTQYRTSCPLPRFQSSSLTFGSHFLERFRFSTTTSGKSSGSFNTWNCAHACKHTRGLARIESAIVVVVAAAAAPRTCTQTGTHTHTHTHTAVEHMAKSAFAHYAHTQARSQSHTTRSASAHPRPLGARTHARTHAHACARTHARRRRPLCRPAPCRVRRWRRAAAPPGAARPVYSV